MTWTRAALALIAAGATAVLALSGGSGADPRTPAALPGMPPPFLGTAVAGDGGLTAAVDAYGDIVDLRAGPAGEALIDNPSDRQAAGTVPADTGVVPRLSVDGGPALPLWRADSVRQSYLPGTNVVRTTARFGRVGVTILAAIGDRRLALVMSPAKGDRGNVELSTSVDADGAGCRSASDRGFLALLCMPSSVPLSRGFLTTPPAGTTIAVPRSLDPFIGFARAIVTGAYRNRLWLTRARPLGPGAPAWAERMYDRSLLTLRALTDRQTGAVAAGARDGWAYVWPRDAGAAALAFAAAGYRPEARRVARFLLGLDLNSAARFHGDGSPVPGRGPQGDASGWVAVAAEAAGLPSPPQQLPWRNRPDYQESPSNTYLGNAIAASPQVDGPEIRLYGGKSAHQPGGGFETPRGLVRRAGDPGSGLDSAAAWAVRPFAQPALYPQVRRTLRRLAARQTRFGITPGEGWAGTDPWGAPTAWTAWSFAALGERRQALRLLGDLRRAATPAGALPERVDAHTGIPTSTTPLAWPHAFAILALRELWPS